MSGGGGEPVPYRGVCEGPIRDASVAKNNKPVSGFEDDKKEDIARATKRNHRKCLEAHCIGCKGTPDGYTVCKRGLGLI